MEKRYRHKILGLIMTIIIAASATGQKIMDLPNYTGNPAGAYTAISIGNVTQRYNLGAFLRAIDTTGRYQPKGNYLTSESDPKRVVSVVITGTATKTVTLSLADGSTVSGAFADAGTSYTGTSSQYIAGNGSYVTFPTIPTNTNQLVNGSNFLTTETDPAWAADKANYYNKPQVDAMIGSGGGGVAGVSSFNSRTGVVVPQVSDYASYYAAISHQHDTTTATTGYATKGYALNLANGKVDKVGSKQLSTEDYTTAEKSKLSGIAAGATNVTNTNQLTNGSGYITSAGTASTISGSISESQVSGLVADLAARKSAADSAHNVAAAYVRQDRMKNYIDSLSSRSVYGGTFSITGDGSTLSFTVPVSSIPALGPTSKVFITGRSTIGAALDHADLSTESITLYYLTAPTAGTKNIDYFIVP